MSYKRLFNSIAVRLAIVIALLIAFNSATALAVNTCGPAYSPGNPYPCGGGGNCTFYAWHMANAVWRQALPGWGNANTWADYARGAGYTVSSEPGSKTIGVSSTLSSLGHVWWNDIITWGTKGNAVQGSEMMWGIWGVRYNVQYLFSTANKGFIYPKPASWRPGIDFTVSSTLWAKPYDQRIGFAGRNFTPGMVVDVTFPSGGMTTLQGAQVQYSSSSYFSVLATLSARGWWKFRAVASDGQRSDPAWVYVN
jgi:surface antigen